MGDYEVTGIRVQDVQTLSANNTPQLIKRVTYYVGHNGPFTLDYTPQEYTADQVKADMQKEVDILTAIGATAGA